MPRIILSPSKFYPISKSLRYRVKDFLAVPGTREFTMAIALFIEIKMAIMVI